MKILTGLFKKNTFPRSIHYEKNLKVLKALKEAGANFRKPHVIEHHIYSYSHDDFVAVSEQGKALGYTIQHAGQLENEEGFLWAQDLVKTVLLSINNIEQQSIEIEHLTKQCHSNYDGWGTEVQQ